ncbi:M23 family metallopeptidase [Arthrobacter sp. PsM3]|uniref:M23 family metallopeptidase n=1 Tax=Arthrobacter sp. PsM3 TaxID=3030531 RepID=UPI00263B86CA|nr:M23 family metallopeptidase [Arthrobacter sp. PsM3]MDN4646461.1 M23 family metallopeptidase [Arthrobacter sp. PsM3]
MRPVSAEFATSQEFGEGATAGVIGNRYASQDTIEYYVGIYGNYQEFGHAGKDIACPIGTPIHAPAEGTVLYAGWVEDLPGSGPVRAWLLYYNFGGIVTVTRHDGWISVIAHQSNNDAVKAGDHVTEGQLIGLSGNTKTRTTTVAEHVHIEALVYLDYRTDVRNGIIYGRVDPTPFFGGIAAAGTITTETPPAEEDDMFTDADRQTAARNNQLLESFQAVLTDPVTGYIGQAALTVLKGGAATQYVKGAADDTIYSREDNGILRGIGKPEWEVASAAGEKFTTVPQEWIDLQPKAGA